MIMPLAQSLNRQLSARGQHHRLQPLWPSQQQSVQDRILPFALKRLSKLPRSLLYLQCCAEVMWTGPHSNLSLKTSVRPSCTSLMSYVQSPTQQQRLSISSQTQASYCCSKTNPWSRPRQLLPISNLLFISKLIEHVIAKRFNSFANSHHLFPPKQSDYCPLLSNETAVLSVYNHLVRATDKGLASVLVLLNVRAVFDTADHQSLPSVHNHHFHEQCGALNWFCSYLSNSLQSFHQSGEASANYPIDCSVPQGFVFGPIGSISYIEDVINHHEVQSHFFADGMQLQASLFKHFFYSEWRLLIGRTSQHTSII